MGARFGILLSWVLLLAGALFPAVAHAEGDSIRRLGGQDRFEVAAQVAQSFAPPGGTVFVASGLVFADALAGGPGAAHERGSLLLVTITTIPADTARALDALKPSKIVVLGGPGTVSDAVLARLGAWAPTERIGGRNRYAVAAGVSRTYFASAQHVVIASGEIFSDALAAGPAASHLGGPLLLSQRGVLPAETRAELVRLGATTVHLVGGADTVSEAVAAEIRLLGATVVRHDGANRYEVSANLAKALWNQSSAAYIAGGSVFPDGLSAAPAAAAKDAPILLSQQTCMPDSVAGARRDLGVVDTTFVGGPDSVSSTLEACSTPRVSQTSVYFVPHQDDELISMVGGITADVAAGRQVWLVKVNRGDYTGANQYLCKNKGICLAPEEFGAARDRELMDSATAMGIPADHVILHAVDETLPGYPDAVNSIIKQTIARFGREAFYHSISFLDMHPSHVPVGRALEARCFAEAVSRCLFYQSPLYQVESSIATNRVITPAPVWLTADPQVVTVAVDAYRLWDPAAGRYAIGWTSVPSQLKYSLANPRSLQHRDRRFAGRSDRATIEQWIASNQDPSWWRFTTDVAA